LASPGVGEEGGRGREEGVGVGEEGMGLTETE
jgi:hypothetical protein